MPIISLIAAVDKSNGIGKGNQLLCHLPADMQYFKQTTMGKPIIMGRRTFDSIGKPLPGRQNIILSRSTGKTQGAETAHSLQQAIQIVGFSAEVMVIGGAQVFLEALPLADVIYLTEIHHHFDADVFFPELDESIWQREEIRFHPRDLKNAYDLTFCRYMQHRYA